MKYLVLLASVLLTFTTTAHADLPMGLKCAPKTKIVGAEIGQEGTYQIQKGMQKEEHRALVNRKKATAVDGCHFQDLVPNDIGVVRYSGPEVYDTAVQCIDQNNDTAQATFPKSIYTCRKAGGIYVRPFRTQSILLPRPWRTSACRRHVFHRSRRPHRSHRPERLWQDDVAQAAGGRSGTNHRPNCPPQTPAY